MQDIMPCNLVISGAVAVSRSHTQAAIIITGILLATERFSPLISELTTGKRQSE